MERDTRLFECCAAVGRRESYVLIRKDVQDTIFLKNRKKAKHKVSYSDYMNIFSHIKIPKIGQPSGSDGWSAVLLNRGRWFDSHVG